MSTSTEIDAPAGLDEVKLAIEGMSCASCVHRVQRALLGVDGTQRVSVNLATRTALVELAAPTEAQSLTDAVESLGYRATVAPTSGSAGAKDDRELGNRSPFGYPTKLVVGVVLTAAVLILAYAFGGDAWSTYLQLALTLPVFGWVGWDFHVGAIKGLRHGSVGMDTLVSVGSTVALIYSVAATAAGRDATAYDVTAVILTVISIGRYLEGVTRSRAHAAVDSLARLQPRTAHLMTPGSDLAVADSGSGAPYVDVPAADLRHGDTVLVLPGEAVPADGSILEGRAAVDESLLTGESFPAAKGPGDEVTGGTVNGLSPIKVRVVRTGGDTTLARILASVERSQTEKSRAQRLADRVASVFVPAILLASLATFVGWLAAGAAVETAVLAAVGVLIVACPCALGLATPVAMMAGAGRGAELGLLISGGEALERARDVRAVVLDKTGTLTVGRPEVTQLVPLDGTDGTAALALAAAVEAGSGHPLGRAIVDAALARDGALPGPVSDVEVTPGAAVAGRVGEISVWVGSIPARATARAKAAAVELAARGLTPACVALDGEPALVVGIADALRADASDGVARLRGEGLRVVLASGDGQHTVGRIGSEVGADEAYGDLMPADKAGLVAELRKQFGPVAMVGDGINDAPALAAADLGIAIGTGSGAAAAASGITVVRVEVGAVADAIALSRAIRRVMRQNLAWASVYNVMLVPLAAFGVLPPALAAVAMATSSVSVVLNALRLRRFGGSRRRGGR